MNGEIPSVPITTLAGIASLTDLLPEMPLPSPLPQTLSNKSLLFHPRVAEEANILLSSKDDKLVPQLVQSLVQTSADHIELKDHYAGTEQPVDNQQNVPELLKGLLQWNPNVFRGPPNNPPCTTPQHWNASAGSSQANRLQQHQQHLVTVNSSHPSSRHAPPPQGSPAACARLIPPPAAAQPVVSHAHAQQQPVPEVQAPSFICHPAATAQFPDATSAAETKPDVPPLTTNIRPHTDEHTHTAVFPNKYPPDTSDSFPAPPSSIPRAHAPLMPGSSPAQASTAPAPITQIKEEFEKRGATPDPKIKEPVVRLNRLSAEDFIRNQRTACAQKSPSPKQNDVSKNHTPMKMTSGSESDEDEPRSKNKYFKNREREREMLRKKEKDQKKKTNQDEDYSPDEFDVSLSERIKKRKRNNRVPALEDDDSACPTEEIAPPKTKLRKLERKLVPVLEKLSIEELMETNTYQRFNRTIEKIFDNIEDLDVSMDNGDEDDDSPALIPKYLLEELYTEAAKLKTYGAMESIPSEKLIRLLSILEKNIRDGAKVSPIGDPDDDEDERKLFMELTMDRVMRAVDASLTTLYILTSPNMHKRVYLEDVIDRVVIFTKFQLHNTIYPAFDPVYRVDPKNKDGYIGSAKKKRAHAKEVREKSVLTLYNKLIELVALLSELLNIQTLTDTAVLHASSMGISPFFVEGVSELQLSALKLVTTIFMKYEKHRKLLLDDILASMARLPSSKRSLRSYRVSSEEYIQMLTALVLQLIQCMVILPNNLDSKQTQNSVDPDVVIVGMFTAARHTANNFLYVFLAKCSSKSEEIDYRPLFENFVQDLLTTVNKPEWPAAELMLSVLGKLLVANFVNKSLEMSLRVASLDYLGVVAARLRKDAVQSNLRLSTIDQIIEEIKTEENKDDDGNVRGEVTTVESDDERIQFLQRVLLDYLAVKGQDEPACIHARHFYLALWYQDATTKNQQTPNTPKQNKANHKSKKNSKRKKKDSSDEEITSSEEEDEEENGKKAANGNSDDPMDPYRIVEAKKKFLLSKIRPFQDRVTNDGVRPQILQTYIDYNSAELVARYLASKRPFSQSFDTYLKHILKVLTEQSVLIRTKAMKCLTMIVEVDSDVLASPDMTIGVNTSFLDHSTSVREAAVDLVGKFVHSRPDLINNYYQMLSERILDTGVSVRKRVIKIMKDICIGCPEYPKIPEICVKMIRRVNDEEGIRKLVMEVFQNMWFTPVSERPTTDTQALIRKVMNITDVVAASKDMGLEWFEQLLLSLFKPKEDKEDSRLVKQEPPPALLLACKQIVDCLIDNVIRLDGRGGGSSQRLVACMVTLFLFSKIRPQLLVDHAITLQPYLSLKVKTQGDYQIISYVAKILELVVPLIEHPSDTFLARLEEDSVKLIMVQDQTVIQSCASCLGSVVNNVTRNFKLIRDCLKKYYENMCQVRSYLETAARNNIVPDEALMAKQKPKCRRAIFVVGVLLRYFDFTVDEIRGDQLPKTITLDIFELFYFLLNQDEDIQLFTMKAIGNVCIRHYDLMLGPVLKTLYHQLLKEDDASLSMKVQVLKNIEIYLQEEERRMIKQDQEWAKMSKKENLKEMGDVSSGMASTIIQLYLKEILVSFLHPDVSVRRAALQVIQLILNQGLVHPIMIVPYLVCMSTDCDKMVSNSADKQLQEIEKKYPGFIHMKAQAGIKLSFQLQKILQMESKVVRGFRTKEGEVPGALNGFLYSILRTKQQKRALIISILQQFDEQAKTSLSQMLFLADNMAYLPYQVQDEPLFIIHQIDIMISVTGTNLLQSFREALIPTVTPQVQIDPMTGQPIPQAQLDEEEDEDEEALLSRVPEDTHYLQECLTASQGCLLLLVLKQHLKTTYGFNDSKITQYSPAESSKVYEKAVNRKSNARFNPKVTVQKIQQGSPPNMLDENARRALILEYLEFKHLMMNLDPDEPDDEDDAHTPQKSSHREHRDRTSGAHAASQSTTPVDVNSRVVDPGLGQSPHKANSHLTPHVLTHNVPHQVEGQALRVPKLTIVPPKPPEKHHHHHKSHKNRKTDRHKKHHHKRKKSKIRSSDDSEHEYSDPDFLV